MATSSATYHEPLDKLSATTQDMHRAIVSLQEELEAVDWYQQRADACDDDELKAVLLHNMREEIEHAAMVLEWLRRRHPDVDCYLRTYLFQKQPIVEIEEDAETASGTATSKADGSPPPGLTVGMMKGE